MALTFNLSCPRFVAQSLHFGSIKFAAGDSLRGNEGPLRWVFGLQARVGASLGLRVYVLSASGLGAVVGNEESGADRALNLGDLRGSTLAPPFVRLLRGSL